jgi:hypothetical protein
MTPQHARFCVLVSGPPLRYISECISGHTPATHLGTPDPRHTVEDDMAMTAVPLSSEPIVNNRTMGIARRELVTPLWKAGKSVREIAAALNIPPAAAHRAVVQLRKAEGASAPPAPAKPAAASPAVPVTPKPAVRKPAAPRPKPPDASVAPSEAVQEPPGKALESRTAGDAPSSTPPQQPPPLPGLPEGSPTAVPNPAPAHVLNHRPPPPPTPPEPDLPISSLMPDGVRRLVITIRESVIDGAIRRGFLTLDDRTRPWLVVSAAYANLFSDRTIEWLRQHGWKGNAASGESIIAAVNEAFQQLPR